ncbi:MAG: tetratricopeptide repeat protein [Pirellulales bacterium]|nr:tetratricopeptide repeat protein [Pirellulales bacterium]
MHRKSGSQRTASSPASSVAALKPVPTTANDGQRIVWGVLAIALLALVAQWPSLGGAGIWDDQIMIFDNERIHAADGLYRFWFTTEQSDYWPLSYSTHWFEYRLWGDWAPGYRLVNLLLHIACSVLVWRLSARLRIPGAWLCGAVFAVHPIALEAVAWTFQRKTVLSTALVFASLACYLKNEVDRRATSYVAALVLFTLAMLAKSAVVMWPFVLLLLAWWQRRSLTRQDLLRAAPFFAVSLVLGLIGMWFQTHKSIGAHAEIVRNDPLWARTAIAGWAAWFYLYKALLPINLAFVYPRWELAAPSLLAYLPGVAILILLALCWRQRRGFGAAPGVALGYYLLNLFPVLGFISIYFMRFSYVADHWQYLALPGIIALVIGGATQFATQRPGLHVASRLAATLVVGLLAVASFDQARVYGAPDNIPLWLDTLEKNPDCWLAHNNLARYYSDRGDYPQAMQHLREALRLDPAQRPVYLRAELAAGGDAARRGRQAEALLHFEHAVEIDPDAELAYLELGRQYFRVGRPQEALDAWRRGNARLPEAHALAAALAWALATHPDPPRRDPTTALALAEKFVAREQHRNAAELDVLAAAYAAAGRFDDAERTAAEALALARSHQQAELATAIQSRLQLYRIQRPYVSP